MLNVDRLADRGRGTRQLWAVLQFLVGKTGGAITGQQDDEEERETLDLEGTTKTAAAYDGF